MWYNMVSNLSSVSPMSETNTFFSVRSSHPEYFVFKYIAASDYDKLKSPKNAKISSVS